MTDESQKITESAPTSQAPDPFVQVDNLTVEFPISTNAFFSRKRATLKAVNNVSFNIYKGECLGLVGESGSGKTTLGRALLQLQKASAGTVKFDGEEISGLKGKNLREIRRRAQIIFQDPYGSLDPRMSVGSIVGEGIIIHKLATSRTEYAQQVKSLLEMVGLNPNMAGRYPHEFSGGQRQRIGIARALAVKPQFIVCDEPVSALDVSIQAQILALLENLQQQLNLTYLFVAHDLAVVRHISDRVAVMYLGKIVEIASSTELYKQPLHPYTYALISGIPIPDPRREATRERVILEGEVGNAANPPAGCYFHPRCPFATEQCGKEEPQLQQVEENRFVSCHRAKELQLTGA